MLCAKERALLAGAEASDGIFTRGEAIAHGLTPGQVDWRLRSGRWALVQPSTYRQVGTPLTWRARVRAAVKSVRLQVSGATRGGGPTVGLDQRPAPANRTAADRVAASYGTAGELLGLARIASTDTVEITVTGTTRFALRDVVVHRTLALPACDITLLDGIPVTTGARTAVDASGRLVRVEALALVDDVIGAGLSNRSWLHRRAEQLKAGRRHVAYLARLTGPGAEGAFRSWLERQGARVFRAGNLPTPRWNVPIYDAGRRLGIADALFDPFWVVVELDGPRFHEAPASIARDRRRDRDIQIAGYLVLRFGYVEVVMEPDRVVAEIRRALARRG